MLTPVLIYAVGLVLVLIVYVVTKVATPPLYPIKEDEPNSPSDDTPNDTPTPLWRNLYVVTCRPMMYGALDTLEASQGPAKMFELLERGLKQRKHKPYHTDHLSRETAQGSRPLVLSNVDIGPERYRVLLTLHDEQDDLYLMLIQTQGKDITHATWLRDDVLDSLNFLPVDDIQMLEARDHIQQGATGAWVDAHNGEDGSL